MQRLLVGCLALALACTLPPAEPSPTVATVREALGAPTVYSLKQVNTVELRSIRFDVTQTLDNGDLVMSICLVHNSVFNAALGVDHFYYDAPAPPYGVKWVNEGDWRVNYDGLQADGFGDFASHKNANPAGRGGIFCENPLVFKLYGDPTMGTNLPLEVAVHLRFEDDCSGWVSNRVLTGSPGSVPACRRKPDCPPPCP